MVRVVGYGRAPFETRFLLKPFFFDQIFPRNVHFLTKVFLWKKNLKFLPQNNLKFRLHKTKVWGGGGVARYARVWISFGGKCGKVREKRERGKREQNFYQLLYLLVLKVKNSYLLSILVFFFVFSFQKHAQRIQLVKYLLCLILYDRLKVPRANVFFLKLQYKDHLFYFPFLPEIYPTLSDL